jgi:hypothetical protein
MNIFEALAFWRKIKPWVAALKARFPGFFAALEEAFRQPGAVKDKDGWTEEGRNAFDDRLDPKN